MRIFQSLSSFIPSIIHHAASVKSTEAVAEISRAKVRAYSLQPSLLCTMLYSKTVQIARLTISAPRLKSVPSAMPEKPRSMHITMLLTVKSSDTAKHIGMTHRCLFQN